MNHITGTPREQLIMFPDAIEDYISADNPVHFLDAFVDTLDMASMGFQHAAPKETGRPPYQPKDLLKLYLYGYLNRIRSSRLLERESTRNLEVMWLLKRLSPDHKTISRFRQQHADAMRSVFKQFVLLCQKASLFGAELVAIDSTKFTASNARDRVKTREHLDKSLQRIHQSITDYLTQLEENDQRESAVEKSPVTKETLQQKITELKSYASQFEEAKLKLDQSTNKHISLTDPDCRLMKNERRIEPAYSVQTAVDAKHFLIIDYELTQDAADNNHLSVVAQQAQKTLQIDELTVCADAGYYDCVDLKSCEDYNITAYVPTPRQKVSTKTNVPTPEYYPDKFTYDTQTDTYLCPQGQTMHRFASKRKEKDQRLIYLYRTPACKECPVRSACTPSKRGRYINRWEHEYVLENLKKRLALAPQIIKQRKAIIEHVFGTIKKVWGYGALLLRGFHNVGSEFALMMLTYNLRRAMNIVGVRPLIQYLHTH
jgi:transposase